MKLSKYVQLEADQASAYFFDGASVGYRTLASREQSRHSRVINRTFGKATLSRGYVEGLKRQIRIH